jgi:hypothetical protein
MKLKDSALTSRFNTGKLQTQLAKADIYTTITRHSFASLNPIIERKIWLKLR